jgi:carboxylate-amine ligase
VRRHDAGEPLPVAPTWRIEENRWSALRDGVRGTLADLETGELAPTAERLAALLGELEPVAAGLGCAAELEGARALIAAGGGAQRQRDAAARGGPRAVVAHLEERFLAEIG